MLWHKAGKRLVFLSVWLVDWGHNSATTDDLILAGPKCSIIQAPVTCPLKIHVPSSTDKALTPGKKTSLRSYRIRYVCCCRLNYQLQRYWNISQNLVSARDATVLGKTANRSVCPPRDNPQLWTTSFGSVIDFTLVEKGQSSPYNSLSVCM